MYTTAIHRHDGSVAHDSDTFARSLSPRAVRTALDTLMDSLLHALDNAVHAVEGTHLLAGNEAHGACPGVRVRGVKYIGKISLGSHTCADTLGASAPPLSIFSRRCAEFNSGRTSTESTLERPITLWLAPWARRARIASDCSSARWDIK
ncbi:hypothetical protein EVAR_11172_1 [Eumeta japonica]|uniref:Uncharacterized protein n=1 Tax=Eumeta variegata TaxID=151549 RepID=A0A4C1U4B0_EUMVA|nr:hypothetical protein EVAR_11172_1 [Eumeta japonica]